MELFGAELRQWKEKVVAHIGPLQLPSAGRSAGNIPDSVDAGKRSLSTEQRKHRRLRRAPYAPAFLLSGHLIATSVAHRIQGGGPISWSGNRAVLEMLKGKEAQRQEFPSAIITFRQGNSGCLTSPPKSRTHHRALKSRGCVTVSDTKKWEPETHRCRP